MPRWLSHHPSDGQVVMQDHNADMPRSRMWGWIRSAAVVVGVIALYVAGFALVAAARDGRQPWESVALIGSVLFWGWWTVRKLTSSKPVDEGWHGHIGFTLISLVLVVFGVGTLLRGGFAWARPLGALSLVVGLVLLVAEYLDLRRWRANVDEERFFARQKDRARAAHEVPPATGEPEANRPRAW